MTDIVDRLHRSEQPTLGHARMVDEAADEITRLRAVVADVARWVPQDACLDINTWDALRPHRTPTERHEAR